MKKDLYSNETVVELLRSIAAAYELKNENRFKIVAYEQAADSIEHLSREIRDVWQDDKLDEVPGLGPSIRASLDEYFKTGKVKHFQQILKDIPPAVFPLMNVPSIGPKKAFKLVTALKLKNPTTVFTELLQAALAGKIEHLPTFGKKSQNEIISSLQIYEKHKKREKRMPLPVAFSLAEKFIDYLKQQPHIVRVDALGSLRRMVSTIGDIDLAAGVSGGILKDVVDHFTAYKDKIKIDNAGDNKASIIVVPNIRVDLRVQDIKNYGPMLQYFTGSKSHNIKLREYALKKGYSLSEHGIKKLKGTQKTIQFETEEKFYEFLGLPYIPPEIREGTNEVDLALKHKLPHLVELPDIKGDLHTHSSYDLKPSHDTGKDSYVDLLQEAKKYHYEYLGFTDHNPKLSDLTQEETVSILKKRKHFIEDHCTKVSGVHYFIGLETDILPTGKLAFPEKALEYIDFLIVSVHSSFGMDVSSMTKRVLTALSHPKVKILGHPTGRLLGKRSGFELKWAKLYDFVAEHDIALEINSWTDRLDLPDSLVREAKDKGVKFVVDTDSHAKEQMNNMKYGVSVARRGWLTKHDIINTRGYHDFKDWILST